ncbi:MAG: redox-regulated ATPase YchF [Bacillota bacterium]
MGLSVGIVGLPNVGKSTLFNAITKAGAEAANYPFCTIEPNVGVVDVPDERLPVLAKLFHSKRIVPTAIKFIDIAGIVKGASKGEGLGNKFLHHIREVDAIAHVVRCFEDSDITHVHGKVDPLSDIEVINLELILADMETVDKRYDRIAKAAKAGVKEAQVEYGLLVRLKEALEDGKAARTVEIQNTEEAKVLKELHLITAKPVMYIANVTEEHVADPFRVEAVRQVKELAGSERNEVVPVSAKIESELAEMDDEERAVFLADLGLTESGLDRVIRSGYDLLNLMSFLTAGETESRAWTIRKGTKAPQAAGEIHSDIERGFIRAEIVTFDDLVAAGSMAAAREAGKVRLEGKEYVMQDGDVVNFRFNV